LVKTKFAYGKPSKKFVASPQLEDFVTQKAPLVFALQKLGHFSTFVFGFL
jgi:hypothetical protein